MCRLGPQDRAISAARGAWRPVLPAGQAGVRSQRALCAIASPSLADTRDVLLLATREHSEDPMRHRLHTLASLSFVVSLVLLGYTVNDLSTGLTELPQHWWSSGAAALAVASGSAALLTRNRPATRSPATG
jgi:hypothetical protein